jgi:uncharacterized membrane protein YkvA (DUF1232 family)
VPWLSKLLAALVAAYAFSPIDLIPDFIPVLGLVDELLLLPGLIWLALRLVPPKLLVPLRRQAAAIAARPVSRTAAVAIGVLWVGGLMLLAWLAWRGGL